MMAATKGNGRNAGHAAPAKDYSKQATDFIATTTAAVSAAAIEIEELIVFFIRYDKKRGRPTCQKDVARGRIARQRIRAARRLV